MSWLAFRKLRWAALALRLSIFPLVIPVGIADPFAAASVAQAAPVAQSAPFQCNEQGLPGQGVHTCHNWTTPAGSAGPGGTITWTHTCDNGFIVIYWWVHYDGAPFNVDRHTFGNNRQSITVTATNEGSREGSFWVTGRCRSA